MTDPQIDAKFPVEDQFLLGHFPAEDDFSGFQLDLVDPIAFFPIRHKGVEVGLPADRGEDNVFQEGGLGLVNDPLFDQPFHGGVDGPEDPVGVPLVDELRGLFSDKGDLEGLVLTLSHLVARGPGRQGGQEEG